MSFSFIPNLPNVSPPGLQGASFSGLFGSSLGGLPGDPAAQGPLGFLFALGDSLNALQSEGQPGGFEFFSGGPDGRTKQAPGTVSDSDVTALAEQVIAAYMAGRTPGANPAITTGDLSGQSTPTAPQGEQPALSSMTPAASTDAGQLAAASVDAGQLAAAIATDPIGKSVTSLPSPAVRVEAKIKEIIEASSPKGTHPELSNLDAEEHGKLKSLIPQILSEELESLDQKTDSRLSRGRRDSNGSALPLASQGVPQVGDLIAQIKSLMTQKRSGLSEGLLAGLTGDGAGIGAATDASPLEFLRTTGAQVLDFINQNLQEFIAKASAPPPFIEQARGMAEALAHQFGGSVRIGENDLQLDFKIKPPLLGEVQIALTLNNNRAMQLTFTAANEKTATLLNDNLQIITHALGGLGINVESIQVLTSTQNSGQTNLSDGDGAEESDGLDPSTEERDNEDEENRNDANSDTSREETFEG